ncbi:MAG: hypothetical protein PVI21_04985 [Candidatus Woesebacteria bacterium]|jgi:hypothetical protein
MRKQLRTLLVAAIVALPGIGVLISAKFGNEQHIALATNVVLVMAIVGITLAVIGEVARRYKSKQR